MLLNLLKPSTSAMARLRVATSALPLTVPTSLLAAHYLGQLSGSPNLFAWGPVVIFFGLLTVLDYVVGKDTTNPTITRTNWFKSLPLLSAGIHLAALAWATSILVSTPFSAFGLIGWTFSMGSVSGILAINVAHELIHKQGRLEQWAGGALLSAVCYGTFKVEHTLGHHAWVATPKDTSSARLGENVYAFMLKALWHNPRAAWQLQVARMQRSNQAFYSPKNELFWWTALSLALATSAYLVASWLGVAFFLGQSLIAILHLECINYIEHYGLNRQTNSKGQYEKVTPMHSWNSSYFLTNAYLFQLQRHSDHHANALRPYEALQTHDKAPELPGGYGAMMMLALVPPLWRRVIHPRIPAQS